MIFDPRIAVIMSQVFNVPEEKITIETTKDDLEEWDSLEHIKLILEIEANYNIKFSLEIIPELISVKRIVEEINRLR